MSLLVLVFASFVSYVIYKIISFYKYVAHFPKGPTPLPFFGNLLSINTRALHKDIHKYSKEFGGIFTVFLPGPIVVLSDYDALKEAYVHRTEDFSGRAPIVLDSIKTLKNGGVLYANGESWKENRRHSLMILRDFGMGKSVMEEQVKQSIRDYLEYLDKIKDKSRVDLRWPIQTMVSNIINETLFGFRYSFTDCQPLIDYVNTIYELVANMSSAVRFIIVYCPWIKYIPILGYRLVYKNKEYLDKIDNYIRESTERALVDFNKDDEPTCFVQAYCKIIGSSPNTTKDQLQAICSDFFFAGQETTTTTLRWALLLLAANQDKQDRLREELSSVCGLSIPSMIDKQNLPYTSATIHEIQRLANILMTSVLRQTLIDTEVMGHKIPKGTLINGDIHQILAHDPIFERPEEFIPERYLNKDGKTLNKNIVDRTVPYSMGKRQCAGEALARVELFMGVAATVQNYRILPSSDGPIDLTPIAQIIMLPKSQNLRLEPIRSNAN